MKFIGGNYGTQKFPWPQEEWRGSGEAGKKKQRDFCVVVNFVLFLLCILFVFLLVCLFWAFFLFLLFTCFDLFPCIGGPWQGWGEYRGPGGEWNWGETLKESIKELLRGKKWEKKFRDLKFFHWKDSTTSITSI